MSTLGIRGKRCLLQHRTHKWIRRDNMAHFFKRKSLKPYIVLIASIMLLSSIKPVIFGDMILAHNSNFETKPSEEVHQKAVQEDIQFLSELVEDLDGEIHLGELDAFAIKKNNLLSRQEMKNITLKLMDILIAKEADKLSEDQIEFNSIDAAQSEIKMTRAEYIKDNLQVQVSVQNMTEHVFSTNAETHFVIKVTNQSDQLNELSDYYSKVQKVFSALDIEGEITTCLSGFLNDKLTVDEKQSTLGKKFNKHGVLDKEHFQGGNVVIKSGYSTKIDEFVIVNDKKMNVNIALAEDQTAGKTSFRVATPILN